MSLFIDYKSYNKSGNQMNPEKFVTEPRLLMKNLLPPVMRMTSFIIMVYSKARL